MDRPLRPRHSGEAGRWITFRGPSGDRATIDGATFVKAGPEGISPARTGLGIVQVEDVSYVRVEHLGLARIIHGPGYSLTVCHTPTRRASEGNL